MTTTNSPTKEELGQWLATDFAHQWVDQELETLLRNQTLSSSSTSTFATATNIILKPKFQPTDDYKTKHQDLLTLLHSHFDSSGLLYSEFQKIYLQLIPLSPYLCTCLWRWMTEEWHQSNKGYRHVQLKRLTFERFQSKWLQLVMRFDWLSDLFTFELLKGNYPAVKYLSGESFEPVVDDVVLLHPELLFLQSTLIFKKRYSNFLQLTKVETVILRIFYMLLKSPPPTALDVLEGRCKGISYLQFKNAHFHELLYRLPQMEINHEIFYFSYKHYFVIYCKFYDLDQQEQFQLNLPQFMLYENQALNRIACERIFEAKGFPHPWRICSQDGIYLLQPYSYQQSGIRQEFRDSGLGLDQQQEQKELRTRGKLCFIDFAYFILSEEDKSTPAALEYWFRILDLDEDGLLSLYELEQYWKAQEPQLYLEGAIGLFEFRDVICVALDLARSSRAAPVIHLSDLKKQRELSFRFFDFFINIQKLMERESTNGNRLYREIEDFLCFMQLPDLELPKPKQQATAWSRWADGQYDSYIEQEELEMNAFQKHQQQQSSEEMKEEKKEICSPKSSVKWKKKTRKWKNIKKKKTKGFSMTPLTRELTFDESIDLLDDEEEDDNDDNELNNDVIQEEEEEDESDSDSSDDDGFDQALEDKRIALRFAEISKWEMLDEGLESVSPLSPLIKRSNVESATDESPIKATGPMGTAYLSMTSSISANPHISPPSSPTRLKKSPEKLKMMTETEEAAEQPVD